MSHDSSNFKKAVVDANSILLGDLQYSSNCIFASHTFKVGIRRHQNISLQIINLQTFYSSQSQRKKANDDN
jgi:hypothetical protein